MSRYCECYCECYVALPHGAVGWSEVCDCGTPDHTYLLADKVPMIV